MNNKIKSIIILIVIVIILGSIIGIKEYLSKRLPLREILQDKEVTESVTSAFALMLEQSDGTYKESRSSTWPSNMIFNNELSGCIDVNGNIIDNAISYDNNTKLVTVRTTKTAYCYVYFDKDSSVYAKVIDDYLNNNGVNKLSDSDKGNRDYDTYYYTGDVVNNNVLYAGFCWKMVITTEGNGVKMIYNGVASNGSCDNNETSSHIETIDTAFNTSINSPAYVGYMYNKVYTTVSKKMVDHTEYVYGNSVTWDGNNYTLVNTISGSWSSIYNSLNNNHYTCLNTTGICKNVYYTTYTSEEILFYLILTDGVNIEEAINEMLYAEDVNKYDSEIKAKVDNWYEYNLLNMKDSNGNLYSNYLQNTIYCANREVISLGAFNPNGGSNNTSNYWIVYNYNSLDCANMKDQFTLKVDNGGTEGYGNNALDYPIGLLNYEEANLAKNGSSANYLNNNSTYWLLSPYRFDGYGSFGFRIADSGIAGYYVYDKLGIRPSVTLSNKVEITLGDGTVANPYVVGLA